MVIENKSQLDGDESGKKALMNYDQEEGQNLFLSTQDKDIVEPDQKIGNEGQFQVVASVTIDDSSKVIKDSSVQCMKDQENDVMAKKDQIAGEQDQTSNKDNDAREINRSYPLCGNSIRDEQAVTQIVQVAKEKERQVISQRNHFPLKELHDIVSHNIDTTESSSHSNK
ncbi:hypothetical protein K7X08_016466 [Anisodus acutangulus]|uniref:Uncharacterized protein n=1 Tax=Anisodus acutangulus TaxID=402998 RepID=A0A9Q1R0J4_9SOLA|nr:hypothetical protein K7X08_016466 [Anisodus acutangulus]